MSVNINTLGVCGHFSCQKSLKIFRNKFGGKEKMSTFAIPNEKRGTKALQVWLKKFIEKTDYCTRSKYREKQFIEKR